MKNPFVRFDGNNTFNFIAHYILTLFSVPIKGINFSLLRERQSKWTY